MSDHSSSEIPKEQFFQQRTAGPLTVGLGLAGLIGIVGSVIGFFVARQQMAFSWLFAFSFFFTILAGGLFWVILHHATNSGWSTVVRRQMENIAALLPYLAIFFIPVLLLAKPEIYSWMRIDPHTNHLLHSKEAYLNIPFFIGRAIGYLVFLSIASILFRRFSMKQDKTGEVGLSLSMRKLSFATLPFFGLSLTFAAVDWLMTLDYTWYSTMWGVYIFAGAAGAAMAVLILVISALQKCGYLDHIVSKEHYHIMGKLLFAFTVFWAYIGFSQYMLTWYANIPEETSYFLRRNTDSWHTLSTLLVLGHFFVPFVILLQQDLKKLPRLLSLVAIWMLAMHLLDHYIIVMPILHPEGFRPSIFDLAALLAIGAPLALLFVLRLSKSSLFPARDPRLVESLHLAN